MVDPDSVKWQTAKQESYYAYINLDSDYSEESLRRALILKGSESASGRARFCLHESQNSRLHCMLIYHDERTRVPLHKHIFFGEYIVISLGSLTLKYFDPTASSLVSTVRLTANVTEPHFIRPGHWHTLEFTQPTIFYEITAGPYDENNTIRLD